jgi:5-formyltetrahydrofolate cyclo-ligase
MSSNKQSLREHAQAHRNTIHPLSEDYEFAIEAFYKHFQPFNGKIVGLYWPIGREFDTRGLLDQLLRDGIICALPVMQKGSRLLSFRSWKEGEPLTPNKIGIEEPLGGDDVKPDILIVPMLAFDRKGHRLGYGGGYYDTTISALRTEKNVIAVGWAYSQQAVLFPLPVEEHDIAMDWIITPQQAHSFGS